MLSQITIIGQNKNTVPDTSKLLIKANDLQIKDYTAQNGKNGKNTPFLIQLLTLGALNTNGKSGKDGPHLKIMVSRSPWFGQAILMLRILSPKTNLMDTFYVNPAKGQIKIIADGSNGGAAGITPQGIKGDDGDAGKAGEIEVLLDSACSSFASGRWFVFSNKEGEGRNTKKYKGDEADLGNGRVARLYDPPVKWTIAK